jgi:hypothetical protein
MASQFTRDMLAAIKAAGGWTWVFEQIGEGQSFGKVAAKIIMPSGKPVSPGFLNSYVNRNPTLSKLKRVAFADAAQWHAEEGLRILEDANADDVVHSKDHIAKAKTLSEYHRWLAQMYDKEFWGDKKQAATQINLQLGDIGALHVHASKEAQKRIEAQKVEAHVLTAGGTEQPVDAEIITEENES